MLVQLLQQQGLTAQSAPSKLGMGECIALADVDASARGAFDRLAQALEAAGSFVIPLQPDALSDAKRYELVLRPGIGAPRVVRPGFLGPGHVVQQRARVLADPAWLGTMR